MVDDPSRSEHIAVADLVVLLGEVERLRAALWARLVTSVERAPENDRLLTIEVAAERLATTKDWLRRCRTLPFVVQLSDGQIRYSEQGIERFIRDRQPRKNWR